MTLGERLSEFVRAAFTGLWVQSFEHDDAIAEIAQLCHQQRWALATWDIDRGLNFQGRDTDSGTSVSAGDPLTAIRSLGAMANPEGTSLLVLQNFNRFLNNIEVVQALDSAIAAGKTGRTFVVVLSAVVNIPVELERQFVVIEHDLAGRDQLERIARGIATEPGELPGGEELTAVLDAAAGLTRVEAENALSLSLVRHNRVTPDVLWELKAQTLKKSGFIRGKRARVLKKVDMLTPLEVVSKALQTGRSACPPACCITPSASAAMTTSAPTTSAAR